MRIALFLTTMMTLAAPAVAAKGAVDTSVGSSVLEMQEHGPLPICGSPSGCNDR